MSTRTADGSHEHEEDAYGARSTDRRGRAERRDLAQGASRRADRRGGGSSRRTRLRRRRRGGHPRPRPARADGGWAFGDADAYRAIFRALRHDDGLVVYPTMLGSTGDPAARFAHVDALGTEGLLDWAPLDCGTTYLISADGGRLAARGFAYQNPVEESRHALGLCVRHVLAPSVAAYEPNFVRQLLLLLPEFPGLRRPMVRFMFGGARLAFGFPPEPVYLDAYLHLLRDHPHLP
jgi:hypothetical protein